MNKNSKYKILLVEDNKFLSKAYQDGLLRAGFKVIIALDGVEAIEKIKGELPDLILLDLIMPLKNGFEVLEEIKKDNEFKNIPIIILSNLGQDSDINRGKELGAEDYLIKSDWSIQGVVDKVKEHITNAKGTK